MCNGIWEMSERAREMGARENIGRAERERRTISRALSVLYVIPVTALRPSLAPLMKDQ